MPTKQEHILDIAAHCKATSCLLQCCEDFGKKFDEIYSLMASIRKSPYFISMNELQPYVEQTDLTCLQEDILTILTEHEVFSADKYLSGECNLPLSPEPQNSLTHDEVRKLKEHNLITPDMHIAFVGCGCVPTTALELIEMGYQNITIVDSDARAVEKGQQVLNKYFNHNLDNLTVIHGLAQEMDYAPYDMIWLANFIDNKETCMDKIIQERKGEETIVLTRNSEGVRALVNRSIAAETLEKWGEPVARTAISEKRINTTYIYKV